MADTVKQQIQECIENKESFILDAGAGSGKTWTLVETLNYIFDTKNVELSRSGQKVVCITFTNVAKNEIIERTEHNSLIVVNTIHDFLWDCIKRFQQELQVCLIRLIEQKLERDTEKLSKTTERAKKTRERLGIQIEKHKTAIDVLQSGQVKITYANFPNYKKGKFWHPDLLQICLWIFQDYPQIHRIVSDSFPIIFVDEYQDTQVEVIAVLLDHLNQNSNQVIGFFGDKVQQIYGEGIGSIPDEYNLKLIQKNENYRSSFQVISLLNNLRDDLKQIQPPSNTRQGEALFFYNYTDTFNATQFINDHLKDRWTLDDKSELKVLHLTHRYIAKDEGYEDLLQIFSSINRRDVLIRNSDNRGSMAVADFLFDATRILHFFEKNEIVQLLNNSTFDVCSFDTKRQFKELLEGMITNKEAMSIGEAIAYFHDNTILKKSDRFLLQEVEEERKDFYQVLFDIPYMQFFQLFQVQENQTPLSTKHNTKGDEFDNVLIIIDDNAWKQSYNFNAFFSGTEEKENRRRNTNNLFYVSCSRARNNVAVVCSSSLDDAALEKLNVWFDTNVIVL